MSALKISEGMVFHGRKETTSHSFRYPVFTLLIPILDEHNVLRDLRGQFGGLLSIRAKDYLRGTEASLNDSIRNFLKEECGYTPEEIFLQTFPRMFGYAFNPVSFWFCKKAGRLDAVLCEVNNTFGERHFYWLHPEGGVLDGQWLRAEKVFHVSPFFPVDGYYKFRFSLKEVQSRVDIFYYDLNDQLRLSTWIEGRHSDLSEIRFVSLLLKYGWMTPLVVFRIHWQALKLWAKKVRFYRKPEPPQKELT